MIKVYKIKQQFSITLLLAFSLAVVMSCSDSDEPPTKYNFYFNVPRVTGYVISDQAGQIIGSWGDLTQYNRTYRTPIFPTPARMSSVTIRFAIPEIDNVRIWIVRALGPGEEETDYISMGGADVVDISGAPIFEFSSYYLPGYHYIEWDGNDEFGNPQPSGFYFCYISTHDMLTGSFLLLVQDCNFSTPGITVEGCD